MEHCPSQDWDRYSAGEDAAAESKAAFFRQHLDRIITVAAGLVANQNVDPFATCESDIIEQAARIVQEAVGWADPTD